jgi:hypothetical protein
MIFTAIARFAFAPALLSNAFITMRTVPLIVCAANGPTTKRSIAFVIGEVVPVASSFVVSALLLGDNLPANVSGFIWFAKIHVDGVIDAAPLDGK